jgi:predicted O-methyltransferase YrrM
MKQFIKKMINRLPYIKDLYSQVNRFNENACFPPGHFYSPIVLVKDIKNREARIWKNKDINHINGINLNIDEQKSLINKFSEFYKDLPFKAESVEGLRYKFNNGMYSFTDGIILYSMMRYLEPKKIIEVGSGHSSALMLDVNQLFFENKIELSLIEPYPKRLFKTITKSDKKNTEIIEKNVQEVDLNFFMSLEKGDILFIDSTHVSKCGSDVNYILFEILPILKTGVFIHFHDIFYPFEYPKEWVYEGRNWNENYVLRAFLMNNKDYEIKIFSHYLHEHYSNVFNSMPLAYENNGGNLWLEKVK